MALTETPKSASADTYATQAEYEAYATAMGLTLTATTDAAKEGNLRRARLYLDRAYVWHGTPTTSTQALAWPRSMSVLVDGYSVDVDTVPQRIKDAQCELAYLIDGGEDPFSTLEGGAVKRKREKVDVLEDETEYADGTGRDRSAYRAVDQLVAPYAQHKAGGSGSIGLVRA